MGWYRDGDKIYAVDLMFMYVNNNDKIKSTKVPLSKLKSQLLVKGWTGMISPMDVIKNKNISPKEYSRILQSDLRYPIMMHKHNLVDGAHRLAKAYLKNKKYIRVYFFDDELMKKFKVKSVNHYRSLSKSDFKKLYKKRFS